MSHAGANLDEAEIRNILRALQDAWNVHNMKAFASRFAEDADFVNVVGWWGQGRAEIEKKHAASHASWFRESTLKFTAVHLRFLTPQIALAHVESSLVAANRPDGTPAGLRIGILTLVFHKQADIWLIAAAHNTERISEGSPPTGPPKS
jgi:uncharacterized protein (TIGR02246 family)